MSENTEQRLAQERLAQRRAEGTAVRVIIYTRTRRDQGNRTGALVTAAQLERCREYVTSRDWELVDVCSDYANMDKREDVLQRVEDGEADKVVVMDFDRWSHQRTQAMQTLIDDGVLIAINVEDTEDIAARMARHVAKLGAKKRLIVALDIDTTLENGTAEFEEYLRYVLIDDGPEPGDLGVDISSVDVLDVKVIDVNESGK